ncbi:MAG: hypothetical protein ABEH58_01605 [Haloplanus sp.]
MVSTFDQNRWEVEPGGGVDSARVALGAVMLVTLAVVALVAHVIGPALAAKAAAAMLPILILSALRTPLGGCSMYGYLTSRR